MNNKPRENIAAALHPHMQENEQHGVSNDRNHNVSNPIPDTARRSNRRRRRGRLIRRVRRRPCGRSRRRQARVSRWRTSATSLGLGASRVADGACGSRCCRSRGGRNGRATLFCTRRRRTTVRNAALAWPAGRVARDGADVGCGRAGAAQLDRHRDSFIIGR